MGRLAKVTDASGAHEFKYDKLGRVTDDKKTVDSTGYTFSRTYDSMGRVRTLTYPDTEVVTYTYNNYGDIETIAGVKSSVTTDYIKEVNYNASGQVTFTKYGNNVTSDYTYNSQTLRLSNILTKKPDGTTKLQDLSYTFDNVGNVTHIADVVNSMTQDFTYDDLNRLIQATGSSYGTKTYGYNAIGNMTQKGNLTLSYSGTSTRPHAVTQVSWSTGQGPSYCASSPCSYSYDSNGNMTAQGSNTLTYDSENRLKQIQAYEGTTNTQSYTLKPGWNVVSFTWLPDNKSVSNILSTLVYGTDYDQVSTWDSVNSKWLHWVNDNDFNDFTQFEYGKTYEIYNKTGSDKTFSVTGKSPGPNISHSIKSGDNFISPAVKTATNVTTVLSTLTQGTDYSDVKRFNATTQTWESFASSQFTQFEPGKGYNIIGLQNASFSYGSTQQTTDFVYDSTGSRVKKTVSSTTTIYLGKDYEVEGSASTKYIFLGDRRISSKDSSGTLLFIHSDHINSSNIITDSSGNQAGMFEYDPYGETTTQTGTANPKHKYTGQERDESSHLYYYNARYYDPQIGRFITPDWIVQDPGDPQSLNRYTYARNNPIIYNDPTGNFWWFIAAIIVIVKAAIIGAAVGAALGLLDAAVTGKSIGGAAASGAIGGAIGGALSAVAAPALSSFGDILGKTLAPSIERIFTIGVDVAKVGMSGVHVYRNIKNQEYFSLGFSALGVVSGVEDLVGNRVVESVETKAEKSGVSLKNTKELKKDGKGTGIFQAQGNADVFNPSSEDFKNNFYGQVKDWALKGDHIGDQKRFWGLHVHDFVLENGVVKSFQFHYDAFPAASPLLTGSVLHSLDYLQSKSILGHVDRTNSVAYRAIDSQRFRKPK